MAYDRFMIAPINTGLQTDLKSFMIPDDAFAQLDNAYVFRGRVRKRFGARPMNIYVADNLQQQNTRLRIAIPGGAGVGIVNGAGVANGFIPNGAGPGIAGAIGQMFSINDQYFTVTTLGAVAMLHSGVATGTFNTATGAYAFVGSPVGGQVYFYPATPVMGFAVYEIAALNNNPTIAFDRQFAYQYNAGSWERLGTAVWTGTDLNFFWSVTWHNEFDYSNVLYVTNYNQADNIKYWNGVTAAWTTMTNLRIGPNNATAWYLLTCRILVVFKNRLFALNTIENVSGGIGIQTFVNRARFSRNGDPRDLNESWLAQPGRGGWIDAPTKEAIITAQILKDRLIVYFESSTWEIVYTGNEVLPFRWQNIK